MRKIGKTANNTVIVELFEEEWNYIYSIRGKVAAKAHSHIGKKIRDIREKLHWSRYDLAKKAGIGEGTLSKIENGASPGRSDILNAIFAVLPND